MVLGEVREVLTGIVGRSEGQEKRGRVPSESCGREERGTSLNERERDRCKGQGWL